MKAAVNNGKAEKLTLGFAKRTKVLHFRYFPPALHTPPLSFI